MKSLSIKIWYDCVDKIYAQFNEQSTDDIRHMIINKILFSDKLRQINEMKNSIDSVYQFPQ